MKKSEIFSAGILYENPVLRLALGTCPTLAISIMAKSSLGMGLAATFVLLGSNIVISALRKVIPSQVRIPAYITIIAGFVTVVDLLIKAFSPALNDALGIYLPLIVVNCIILGRAEMFASKNPVLDSAVDAVGMGLGFTLVITLIGIFREFVGSGSVFGISVGNWYEPITFFVKSPGGFLVFGLMMAAAAKLIKHLGLKNLANKKGCDSCEGCNVCGGDK